MNRDWNPFEEAAAPPESVRVFGIELRVGDRVRICPKKKADIHRYGPGRQDCSH